jgi:hypothetical protein
MSVIGDAFTRLKANLEITTTEEHTASSRHQRIRDHVRTRWTLIDDFLTGSYRRETKTKPLKDVDMFVVIDASGPQGYLRTELPRVVLDELLKVLEEKWPDAYIDGMAVVIPFGPDDAVTSMEVVPAFERAGGGWFIPDPDRSRWLATNPKKHHEMSTTKNKECDGDFVPFVKMVKAANRELGDKIEPSFLLEVMAQDIVRAPFGRFSDELVFFFANGANRINDAFDDPAGLGGDVNTMNASQRILAKQALEDARRVAENAVDLADEGQERAAVKEWQKLFGKRMPNP